MVEEFIVHPEVRKKMEKLIKILGLVNFTLNIEPGSIKGDNYLGIIAKSTAKGTNKNGKVITLKWIIKSAPQIDAYRNFMNLGNIYGREIYMYTDVFPLYQKFQADKDVVDPFTSTAPIHMSCLEEYQECLVMEDMKALGYVMKNRMDPLDYNHVRLVMRAYGKFHAISYALKDQNPEQFGTVANNMEENFFRHLYREHADKYAKMYCEKALDSLNPVLDAACLVLFEKFYEKPMEVLFAAFDMGQNDPYSVVGHGDSWVNNMLFRYDNPKRPNNPTDVCLLDFQLAKYGSPAFDLSYFIFTCTDKALRDNYYDQMIRIYYSSLCSHLVDLGSDPEKLLPFHALQSQLKRFSIYGLYMSIMVLHLMMSETDEIPDLSEAMSDEEIAKSFNVSLKNVDSYNARIRGVIIDFVERGYLDFLCDV